MTRGIAIGTNSSDRFAAPRAITANINAFHQETPRYMGIRELVQNGIDAIARYRDRFDPNYTGRVFVGQYKDSLAVPGQLDRRRLCVADNGISMTYLDVKNHLNTLANSSSINVDHTDTHKGQGAKSALLPVNRAGMEYLCMTPAEMLVDIEPQPNPWACQLKENTVDYEGAAVYELACFGEDEHGQQTPCANADAGEFEALSSHVKMITSAGHGTIVILNGNEGKDTIDSESILTPAFTNTYGVVKFLNSRYFSFPEWVTVNAEERAQRGGLPSEDVVMAHGAEAMLNKATVEADRGAEDMILNDYCVRVHWWVMPLLGTPTLKGSTGSMSRFNSRAHISLAYKNEIYDNFSQMDHGGTYNNIQGARLRRAGVYNITKRTIIYIEILDNVHVNAVRSHLLTPAGEVIDVNDFLDDLRLNLPERLKELILANETQVDEMDSAKLREDLQKLNLRFQSQETTPGGIETSSTKTLGRRDPEGEKAPSGRGKEGRPTGPQRTRRAPGGSESSRPLMVTSMPPVIWQHLERTDIAAEFDSHTLVLNEDWAYIPTYVKMVMGILQQKGATMPEETLRLRCHTLVRDLIRSNLAGRAYGAKLMAAELKLGAEEALAFLTQEALTTAALPSWDTLKYIEQRGRALLTQ
jgi:hypothetical protein